ncbi:hypothetical protein LTR17_004564 [Elasticomyces elasticus]|nr:hypothetical protein LTR17_004564 [Elasticomyces elasticus]
MSFNTRPTSFFSLPAELRCQIYSHALAPPNGVHPTVESSEAPSVALLCIPPIRKEALPIYWRENRFHFELSEKDIIANAPQASAWMVATGPNVPLLGGLIISHEDRFSLELGHAKIRGKPVLVVKRLTLGYGHHGINEHGTNHAEQFPLIYGPYNHFPVQASINYALRQLYEDPNNLGVDLASYYAHNLVGGLAQFLYHVQVRGSWQFDPFFANALQFITGCTRYYQRVDTLNMPDGIDLSEAGTDLVKYQHEQNPGTTAETRIDV